MLLIGIAFVPIGTCIIDENEFSSTGLAPPYYEKEGTYPFQSDKAMKSRDIIKTIYGDKIFYAYNLNDPSGVLVPGPVKFNNTNPGDITQLAATSSTEFIAGATWINDSEGDRWYGCEYGLGGNRNIWTINEITGDMTLIGSYDPMGTGISLNGLAYDLTSGIMYGCSDTDLYIINMSTGNSTLVGSFGLAPENNMIAIAFDGAGNLYGDEIDTDNLYQIDITSGEATLIGSLGVNIRYAQDMAYDIDDGILYLAAYTISPAREGALYTCNTTTGAATKIGTFQGAAQITGFAIPYGGTPPQDTTPPITTHQFTPVTPDGLNDWYVSDVTITFTAIDTQSGVDWTKYSLNNGGTWTTHAGPGPFDVIVSSGIHQILYNSADIVGNVEPIKGPFVILVDTINPQKSFFTFPIVFGPVIFAFINLGLAKDSISGLDRVEYQLNSTFHHQTDLSWWPTGILCPIYWFHIGPNIGDVCTCTVYDKAGNSV